MILQQIFYLSIFLYLCPGCCGVITTNRYQHEVTLLNTTEYKNYDKLPWIPMKYVNSFAVTCGYRNYKCLVGECSFNNSNVIFNDYGSYPGCIPSKKSCYCAKENLNIASYGKGTEIVKIVYDDETHIQILASSAMEQTQSISGTATFFLDFVVAPNCTIHNVAFYRGIKEIGKEHYDYPLIGYRSDVQNDRIVKMSLTVENIQITDTGLYEMSLEIGNIQIKYVFYLFVNSFAVTEQRVMDETLNEMHMSSFWQPNKFYQIFCQVEGGLLLKDSFKAYTKNCSLKSTCNWDEVNVNQTLTIMNGTYEKKAILKLQAEESIQSYRITFGNKTCTEGNYIPTDVPDGFFVDPTPERETYVGKTLELNCRFHPDYFEFRVWHIEYDDGTTRRIDLSYSIATTISINITKRNAWESVVTLKKSKLDINDTGVYTCVVEPKSGQNDTIANLAFIRYKNVIKIVPGIPYFTTISDDTTYANEGDTVHLKCIGEGYPKPQTVWFDHNNNNVSIKNVISFPALNTTYRCEINNKHGRNVKTFKIIMKTSKLNINKSNASKANVSDMVITILVIVISFLILLIAFLLVKTVQQRHLKYKLEQLKTLLTNFPTIALSNLGYGYYSTCSQLRNIKIDPEMYIHKDRLQVRKDIQLGCGYFGSVYKGWLKFDYQNDPLIVAVKTPRIERDYQHYSALIAEFMIMSHIDIHVNLLAVYGAVIENLDCGELYVVFEYCEKGSLLSYLKRKHNRFLDEFSSSYQNECIFINFDQLDSEIDDEKMSEAGSGSLIHDSKHKSAYPFSEIYIFACNLLQYAYQIADGMSCLASLNVVHRDLALRNILITDKHVVKIADFGLALDKVYNPRWSEHESLPVKWMPPEAIFDKEFSTHSDVWSFGIVLWEIFSLGQEPYEAYRMNNSECVKSYYDALVRGERLCCPFYAPIVIYSLMKSCWNAEKEERPSFDECKKVCGNYLKENFPVASAALLHLLKTSQPYVNMRHNSTRREMTEDILNFITVTENASHEKLIHK